MPDARVDLEAAACEADHASDRVTAPVFNNFWKVRSPASNEHMKEKTTDQLQLSPPTTSNETCNTGHAP